MEKGEIGLTFTKFASRIGAGGGGRLPSFGRSATRRAAILAGVAMLPAFGFGAAAAQPAPNDGPTPPAPANKAAPTPAPADARGTAQAPPKAAPRGPSGGSQIIVTGKKPLAQHRPGAAEYDVTNNLQGTTGSAADLLNTLPSVSVTSDGEVSLRGRTDVEVLIDGRPSAATDKESRGTTLQTMPGSSIKSVEVITNPSAGVNSQGASVINLKLKHDAALGPHASLAGDIDQRRRGRISLDSAYGWEHAKLDLDATYREALRLDGAFTTRRYDPVAPGDVALSEILADYTPTRSRSGTVETKLRYDVSDKTAVEGAFGYTKFTASNIVDFRTTDFDSAGTVLDRYVRVRDSRLAKDDFDASLSLTRRGIGADGQLSVEAVHGSGKGRSDRTYSLTPDGAGAPVSLTYVGDYQDSDFYRTTADFQGSLAKPLSVKTGIAWETADERFRNGGSDLPLNAPFPSRFVGIPDDFRVARERIEGYFEATLRRTDWTLQSGVKWRGSTFDLSDGGNPPFLRRRFSGLDASLSAERRWSKGKLSLSLSRLLQLPEAQDLNPTLVVVDVQDRYVGNPRLQPQKALRGELVYNRTINGLEAVATLYYRGTEDAIANVYQAIDDNVILTSKINAGLSQEYGGELGLSGKVAPGLKIDLSGNVHRAETSFRAFGATQRDSLVTYSAKAALDWTVGPKDKLRLDVRGEGPSLLVQGRRSGSRAANLVWQHTIDANLSFTLAAQQFLQNAFIETFIDSPTVSTFTRRVNNTTSIQLGVKWKIR